MNIFILDEDMRKSVIYHPDKHIVKMPVEGAQLLCNAFYKTNEKPPIEIYKPSHLHHPLNQWTSETFNNWIWLAEYVLLLGEEYTFRYGKKHSSVEMVKKLPLPNLPISKRTPFVKCVPEEFKHLDVVEAYRQYFIRDKQHLKQYTKRDIPDWWI